LKPGGLGELRMALVRAETAPLAVRLDGKLAD